jgi:hypothetical protein
MYLKLVAPAVAALLVNIVSTNEAVAATGVRGVVVSAHADFEK